MRRLAVALALCLSACSSGSIVVGARLQGPAAIAVFKGVTTAHQGALQTYFAVASSRG